MREGMQSLNFALARLVRNGMVTRDMACLLYTSIYECIEDDNSFSTFSVAIAQLPETKWFPLLVEKWLWYIQGEVEDCISSLKGITL